jgi:hypothetical protein
MLNRLIYKSRCNGMADWPLVEDILGSSTRNNPANDLTGVLVATETDFLQVLEGEFEPLNETFERISRDTRHNKVQIIDFSEIENRKYGTWAMHGVGLFDFNRDLVFHLSLKYGEYNGNVAFPNQAKVALALFDEIVAEKE